MDSGLLLLSYRPAVKHAAENLSDAERGTSCPPEPLVRVAIRGLTNTPGWRD
jgi:hypothetical protein